jgi:L-serine dehydratase
MLTEHVFMISIFDMFSIGIGPSSSHTVGPMRAAKAFLLSLGDELQQVDHVTVELFGSLAHTGVGHGTDKAILMGLAGEEPQSIDPDTINQRLQQIIDERVIDLLTKQPITFNYGQDLIFNFEKILPHHPNGMLFKAYNNNQLIKEDVYYSIGGGFVVNQAKIMTFEHKIEQTDVPYSFQTANELLSLCKKHQLTIAQIMLANETHWHDKKTTRANLLNIANIMEACINKGCETEGILPGGIQVKRRAPALFQKLQQFDPPKPEHPRVMNWLNCYALAVNEENAAGSRVVTAPTNGAAGIIPAVLNFYKYFTHEPTDEGVVDFLLTAGAIGILYKKNASISGAEMGCQGEVGVACSMAAAGLAAVLGGSMEQVETAAEMAMEHNLGLTCDPVAGLVQIPCIERNAIGAVKAVNSAQLALFESGEHKISLDMVINTMREIGTNMNSMYKETSKGGLAVNFIEC